MDVWLANPAGQWKEFDRALDLVPVHAALLPNGKLLFFSWDEDHYKDIKRGKSQVWDPESEQPAPLRVIATFSAPVIACYPMEEC